MNTALAKSIRIGLIVLLWMPLVYTQNETLFPSLVGKSIFARSLIELLAASWVILIVIDPTYRPRRSWVVLAFGAYVVASLLSTVFGVSITKSFWSDYQRMMGVWDLLHWFALVLIAGSVLRTSAQWRFLLNWVLVISLILSVVALAQAYDFWLPFFPHLVLDATKVQATLGNPSFLAAFLVVTTLLALGFLARSLLQPDPEELAVESPASGSPPRRAARREQQGRRNGRQRQELFGLQFLRFFWAAVVVLGVWALFLTGTRGAFVGFVAGLIAMPAALGIWGNRKALLPVAALTGGIVVSLIVTFVIVEVTNSGFGDATNRDIFARFAQTSRTEGTLALRLTTGKIGLQAFADRPILGWGPENYSAAFNKHVDPSFSELDTKEHDQVHISVVEQLATRGIVGGLLFLAMWGAVFWRLVRRRRPPREEVMAYAVLGGLVGYFVQNLALFDTPATILLWAVLFAWVAAQDGRKEPAVEPLPTVRTSRLSRSARRRGESTKSLLSSPWGLGGLVLSVIVLLGFTLALTNQRAYSSAETFQDGLRGASGWTERLTLFQESFDRFPGMANRLRQSFFETTASEWDALTPTEQTRALEMVDAELERGLEAEPRNTLLLFTAIILLQETASTVSLELPITEASLEKIKGIDPLLEQMKELAPNRPQTHEAQAIQELIKRNPEGALVIIDEFLARAPRAASYFRVVKPLVQSVQNAIREREAAQNGSG